MDHLGPQQPTDWAEDGVLLAAHRAVGEGRPLALQVDSDIPIGKGLGSSAAAAVAAIAAALRAVGERANPDRVFRGAAELEGHADNVAAAVYGGLTLVPAEGMPLRLPIHPSLQVVLAVPAGRLPTDKARRVVATTQSQDLVQRSLARVAALSAGLITGDPGLLAAAHGDEIHEKPREQISPEVTTLIDLAKSAGALHAARSGAGPSVIALCTRETRERVAEAFVEAGAEAFTPQVATSGLI